MARKGTLRVRVLGDTKPLVGKLKGLKGKLAGFAVMAGTAVAAGAAVGVGAAIKTFADFDAAMTESLAIMGDVSDRQRGEMSDAARDVAKTTKFSAEQAAESYFFLASAGLDAEQSIGALPQVAKFAQAGMFDMATATDLATDAQSALGLAADDPAKNLENLTRVTDVFVATNTLANTSVEQISEALTNKAGAAMRAVGMDVEEGSAVLAAFADQGVKGAEAGTQFSIVMRDLQTKALENADAFEEAGVAVFDSAGEFNNMGDIVAQLEDRLDGMSDAEKRAELAALGFTDKSIASMMALLGTSDAIKEYEEELRNAAGTTEEVAGKQMETFWAQLGLLKDQLVDVGLEVGESLMPHLEAVVQWLQDHSDEIADWILDAVDSLATFGAGVVEWWTEDALPALRDFIQWIEDNWPKVEAAWEDLAEWVDESGEKLTEFWEDHAKPAIETWVQAIEDNWPKIEEAFGILQEIVANLAQAVFDLASEWAGSSSDMADDTVASEQSISQNLGIIMEGVNALLRGIRFASERISGAWHLMTGLMMMDSTAITRGLDVILGGALSRFGQNVRRTVAEAIEWFRGLPARILKVLRTLASNMWSAGRQAIEGFVNGMLSVGVSQTAWGIARKALDAAKRALGISSPSREFFKVGEDSGEGYNLGLARKLEGMPVPEPEGFSAQSLAGAAGGPKLELDYGRLAEAVRAGGSSTTVHIHGEPSPKTMFRARTVWAAG